MVRLALLLVAAAVHDEPERYPLGATKAWEPGSNDFKKIDNAARLAKKNTQNSGDLAWQLDDKTECYSGAEGLYSKVGAPRPRATRSRSRFPELFFTPARRTLAAHRLLRRRVPALRQTRRVLRRPVVLLHDPGLRDLQPSISRQDRPPRVAQMRVDQVLRTLRAVLPH